MTETTLPAPLWRRLTAAVYDGLLLVGLAFATVIFFGIGCWALGVDARENEKALRFCLFAVGLGFFGGSWTNGGQTLGMRVWQLRVRRLDGSALRWPTAAVRYAVMSVVWGAPMIAVALLSSPTLAARHPNYELPSVAVLAILTGAFVLSLLDARKRAPQDWLSGCEVVVEPKQKA